MEAFMIYDESIIISIHTLRVEGDSDLGRYRSVGSRISIHTLRVEGDCYSTAGRTNESNFNPHPPRGG